MIDAGMDADVTIVVDYMADNDIVDGGGDHTGIAVKTPHIAEGRLFRDNIQILQQQPEAEIADDRLVDNHIAPPNRRVTGEMQGFVQ